MMMVLTLYIVSFIKKYLNVEDKHWRPRMKSLQNMMKSQFDDDDDYHEYIILIMSMMMMLLVLMIMLAMMMLAMKVLTYLIKMRMTETQKVQTFRSAELHAQKLSGRIA